MSKIKVKYNGPKLKVRRGRISYKQRLEAVHFAKITLIKAKMYEEAAKIRDIERDLEEKFKIKINNE